MKKIMVVFLILTFSFSSFSQQIEPDPVLTKQDYLIKSKKQKTTGWILLGTGTTTVIVGAIVDDAKNTRTEQSLTGGIIVVSGIICGLTSIPFFIASGKNKRKALSLSLNFQKIPSLNKMETSTFNYTGFNLKIIL